MRNSLQQFAGARIEPVTGHDGKPTHALYMERRKEDASTKEGTRVQHGIYPPDDFSQAYVRYWVNLQPDPASAVPPPNTRKSRQFMERKEAGSPRADFRWGICLQRGRAHDKLFGRAWGAANGQLFVDQKGRTQKDSGLFVRWPFKLYVGTALEKFEQTPLCQWTDDVELVSKPPVPLPAEPEGDSYTCRTDSN